MHDHQPGMVDTVAHLALKGLMIVVIWRGLEAPGEKEGEEPARYLRPHPWGGRALQGRDSPPPNGIGLK